MPLTPTFTTRALVQKFNPHHGPDGRFASGGSTRRGGSNGVPRSDAFGNPIRKTLEYRKGGVPDTGKTLEYRGGNADAGMTLEYHRPQTAPATQRYIDSGNLFGTSPKQTVAAHSPNAQQAASHVHGKPDGGAGLISTSERQNALLALHRAGRVSGSVGAPQEDAFGRPLKRRR